MRLEAIQSALDRLKAVERSGCVVPPLNEMAELYGALRAYVRERTGYHMAVIHSLAKELRREARS